jgi:hypothetical protein
VSEANPVKGWGPDGFAGGAGKRRRFPGNWWGGETATFLRLLLQRAHRDRVADAPLELEP